MKTSVLFISLIFFITSCVPYPHYSEVTPKISGVVYSENQPLAGVTILQSFNYKDEKCMNSDRQIKTDSNGYFELPKREVLKLVVPFGDAYYTSYLCIDYLGVRKWISFLSVNTETNLGEIKYHCEMTKKTKQDFPKNKALPFFICN